MALNGYKPWGERRKVVGERKKRASANANSDTGTATGAHEGCNKEKKQEKEQGQKPDKIEKLKAY